MSNIFLVEDDNLLAGGVKIALEDAGHAVEIARTGTDADITLAEQNFDLMILDLGLPRMDGLEVLERARKRGQILPVLILTARDSVADRVAGLDKGANDYLVKPFELIELEARVRALLRKDIWNNRTIVQFGRLSFDTVNRVILSSGAPLELSSRELEVLEVLLQGAGRVVLKSKILESMADSTNEPSANGLDIVVHRLRKKLEGSGVSVRTVRGVGYVVEADE
jgi:DNA-binding response OmpR family regulator